MPRIANNLDSSDFTTFTGSLETSHLVEQVGRRLRLMRIGEDSSHRDPCRLNRFEARSDICDIRTHISSLKVCSKTFIGYQHTKQWYRTTSVNRARENSHRNRMPCSNRWPRCRHEQEWSTSARRKREKHGSPWLDSHQHSSLQNDRRWRN